MTRIELNLNTSLEINEKFKSIKKPDFTKALLLICLFGLFIRFLYFFLVVADNQLSGDAASYHLTANIFADGLGFTEPFRYLFGAIDLVPIEEDLIEIITPIGHMEPTAGVRSRLGPIPSLEHRMTSSKTPRTQPLCFPPC